MGELSQLKMMKFVLALAMLASASATTVTWGSAARSITLATGASNTAAGNLVVKFTTSSGGAMTQAADNTITITSSAAVFGDDGALSGACTLAVADATTPPAVATSAISGGAGKVLTITLANAAGTDSIDASKEVTVTCAAAGLVANPAADTAFTFIIATKADATATSAQTGYTINDGKATWGSAARTSVVAGTASANAGDLKVKFTPKNALAPGGTIKLEAYQAGGLTALVFGSDAQKACTVKVGSGSDLASSTPSEIAVATNVLSIKLGADATDKLDAGVEATIVCAKAGLEAIPALASTSANNVYTFAIETTSDLVKNTGLTGYTVTGSSVTWGSATRSSLVGGVNGTLTFKFTPTVALAASDTITLTSSSAIFAYPDTAVACTVTAVADLASGTAKPTFVAATTKSDTTLKLILTLGTTAATDVVAATKEATVLCNSNLAAAPGHTHVYFDIKTSKDVEPLTNQTGYTRDPAPTPTPTAAATPAATTANTTSTVAAASTTSVNMITIVALAAVALRQ